MPTPAQTITITFGSGDYDDLQILHGTIISSNGNPGACLDGGVGDPTWAELRVDLPSPSTVTSVSLDWWKGHPSPYNLLRYVALYDKNDTLLATPINSYTTITSTEWHTISSPTISVANVKYAIFRVHASIAPINLHGRMDNCTITFTPSGPGEPLNPGESDCPVCYSGEGSRGNPIGIRHGEKREEITDISLNTPAGALELVRTYSQDKQGEFQFMGLGWNHIHLIKLTPISGTPNKIIVRLPRGGEAHFTETTTNHYDGVAGVGSFVDWNPTTSQYTLTASDKSTYVFDSSGNLLTRSWPNGESWTYTYSSGKLAEVSDGYGRKLVFRYYTSGSHNGQLYRVGDQTFDDTNPSNPTGRYVEYGYTLNKIVDSSGSIVNGTNSLLTTVRDARGNSWTYDYYGQDAAETDVRQLNFLIERLTPSVDTTGDGTPDGTLSLEEVTYTMQGTELAVNGGMELDSDWASVNAPTTNERSSVQVDSGAYSRHVVASAANQGIEGNSWNLTAGKTYVVTAKVYPVSGAVKMTVTGETAFDRTTSGTGSWQLLRAVHTPTANATGRKLQFVSSGGAAEFYVDTVSVTESDLSVTAINQNRGNSALVTNFAFQPGGQNVTTEVVAGKTTTHQFLNGVYAGPEDPAGNYPYQIQNEQYRPVIQKDANGNETLLSWSSDGKRLDRVADALRNETAFAYKGDDTLHSSVDAGSQDHLRYDYRQSRASHPHPGHQQGELAVNGGMELDSDWTNVPAPPTSVLRRRWTPAVIPPGGHRRGQQGIQGNAVTLVANAPVVLARVCSQRERANEVDTATQTTTPADVGK
jgi:hypothetical protein